MYSNCKTVESCSQLATELCFTTAKSYCLCFLEKLSQSSIASTYLLHRPFIVSRLPHLSNETISYIYIAELAAEEDMHLFLEHSKNSV